jgi:hypothetical protein
MVRVLTHDRWHSIGISTSPGEIWPQGLAIHAALWLLPPLAAPQLANKKTAHLFHLQARDFTLIKS